MKKRFLTILILLLSCLGVTRAYDFSNWGYYFNIISEEDRTCEYTYDDIDGNKGESDYYSCYVPTSGEKYVNWDYIEYKVISIGSYAINNCGSVNRVYMFSPLETIRARAIMNCANLVEVVIPSSVTRIEAAAIVNCPRLSTISVDVDNERYTSKNGVLIDLQESTLIAYPSGRNANQYSITKAASYIGECAFYGSKKLQQVTIPEHVISIGDSAFSHCENLKSVTIYSTYLNINRGAFFGSDSLREIHICSENPPYMYSNPFGERGDDFAIYVPAGSLDLFREAYGWEDLAKYLREEGSSSNPDDPFTYMAMGDGTAKVCGCRSAASGSFAIPEYVEFGQSRLRVTCLGQSFLAGSKCTSISVPSSVEKIETGAFSGCLTLAEIIVDSDSKLYHTVDGVLYSADNQILLAYPAGRPAETYQVQNVSRIAAEAFTQTQYLKGVLMPDKLTMVETHAFTQCKALQYVVFGQGIQLVDVHAFYLNDNLQDVCFRNRTTAPYYACSYYSENENSVLVYHAPMGCYDLYCEAQDEYPGEADLDEYEWYGFLTVKDNACADEEIGVPITADYAPLRYSLVSLEDKTVSVANDYFDNYVSPYKGDVVIPEHVTIGGEVYTVVAIGEYAFCSAKCSSVTMPSSMRTICQRAFESTRQLKSIVLPEGLACIEGEAFVSCGLRGEVTLPSSLTDLSPTAFSNVPKLTSFGVAEGNPCYQSIDGILYSLSDEKGYMSLLRCPVSKTGDLVLSAMVDTIGAYAFADCENIRSVTTSATYVGDQAFEYCFGLEKLDFLNLRSVGSYSFEYISPSAIIIRTEEMATHEARMFENFSYEAREHTTLFVPAELVEAYQELDLDESYRLWGSLQKISPITSSSTLSDSEVLDLADNQMIDELSFTLSFRNTNWRSAYLPFSVPQSVLEEHGITVSELDSITEPEDNVINLQFRRLLSGSTQPLRPLLVKAATVGDVTITLNNVQLFAPKEEPVEFETSHYKVNFYGSLKGIIGQDMVANEYYAMGGGRLGKVISQDVSMGPYRWCMRAAAKTQTSGAPTFRIGFAEHSEELSTGVSTICQQFSEDETLYNLHGAQVSSSALTPGLYVKNGKKVFLIK